MQLKHTYIFILATALLLLTGCARPGTPDGGEYDETPPKVLGAVPAEGSLNIKSQTMEVFFDEYVKLEKAAESVVISPPQLNMPEIAAQGHKIKVKLIDSLKANTTYTIDFGDAIVDNNEGNPLGKYTYTFSTGDHIDSMEVSGKVLNARDLEPIKGIIVGLHSDMADSAFTTKPFDRMARTNGSGEFTIKGVANGNYRIYALQDADGDYAFTQKSEALAFTDQIITPSCFPDTRTDTLWADTSHYELTPVNYTHFVPDNITLLAFSESTLDRHLLKIERKVPEHFDLYFTGPATQRPIIKGLNFDENQLLAQCSQKNDTIIYWIRDTALVHTDTLEAEITFVENDSTGALVTTTQEERLVSRLPRSRAAKMEFEDYKEWAQKQEKLKKKGKPYQEVRPPAKLDITSNGHSNLDANRNVTFTVPEPLAVIDTTKFHLYLKVDSLEIPAEHLIELDRTGFMGCVLRAEWRPEQQYSLQVDSAAFVSIYGKVSDKINMQFSIPSLDTYSSLFVNLEGVTDSTAIVELLNNADKVVMSERAYEGTAKFYFVTPGIYYMRMYLDANGNGQWDEGNYSQSRQAEEVYYYPTTLNLRAKWDVTQNWDYKHLPLSRQKPKEITKQKPDRERKIQNRNAERAKKWKQK